jgi:hypothetical protein
MIQLLLLLQLAAPVVYTPVLIDHLWESTAPAVTIQGTVAPGIFFEPVPRGVQVTFRIGDAHGHFLPCVLLVVKGSDGVHYLSTVPVPEPGQVVVVSGVRKVYPVSERGQGALEIQVTKIQQVEEP